MPVTRLIEALPEGTHAAWLTLDDEITRLVDLRPLSQEPGFEALRLPKLRRAFSISGNGDGLIWPGGPYLQTTAIAAAASPITLLARMPSRRRYRPLSALLRYQPELIDPYLDVRPASVLQGQLRLRPADMDQFLRGHAPVSAELCLARLSDLTLALQTLLPRDLIPALLRRPWPYADPHGVRRPPGVTALDHLWAGRIDLLDAPLARLLIPDTMLVSSDAEAHSAAPTAQQRRTTKGQRDR